MTIINPNSISGIVSVTATSNALHFYESDGDKLNINADLTGNVTGNITGTTATFSGDVTVGGVLTYDDVTNVDSVGVVTARSGLDVLDVGTPVSIDSTNSGLNKIQFKTGGTTSGYLGNSSVYFFSLSDSSGNQRVRHANSGLYQVLDTSGNVIHQMSGAGSIGIGTAPIGDLTVLTNGNGFVDVSGSGGNGAEIKFLKKSDKSTSYTIQNNGGGNELAQHVLSSGSGQYSWYIGGQGSSNIRLHINSSGNVGINSLSPKTDLDVSTKTGAVALPQGTTAQRPTGSAPYIRKNTTNNALEYYDGTSWVEIITDYFPTGSVILG